MTKKLQEEIDQAIEDDVEDNVFFSGMLNTAGDLSLRVEVFNRKTFQEDFNEWVSQINPDDEDKYDQISIHRIDFEDDGIYVFFYKDLNDDGEYENEDEDDEDGEEEDE